MLPLLFLLFLLPFGNAQGENRFFIVPDDGYVLPNYPELSAKTRVNGEFEIEAKLNQGAVEEVKFLICRISGGDNEPSTYVKCRDENNMQPFRMMVQSIERAITQWHVTDKTASSFHLVVTFRCRNTKLGESAHSVYRIEGGFPSARILIEYYQPPIPSRID